MLHVVIDGVGVETDLCSFPATTITWYRPNAGKLGCGKSEIQMVYFHMYCSKR